MRWMVSGRRFRDYCEMEASLAEEMAYVILRTDIYRHVLYTCIHPPKQKERNKHTCNSNRLKFSSRNNQKIESEDRARRNDQKEGAKAV